MNYKEFKEKIEGAWTNDIDHANLTLELAQVDIPERHELVFGLMLDPETRVENVIEECEDVLNNEYVKQSMNEGAEITKYYSLLDILEDRVGRVKSDLDILNSDQIMECNGVCFAALIIKLMEHIRDVKDSLEICKNIANFFKEED